MSNNLGDDERHREIDKSVDLLYRMAPEIHAELAKLNAQAERTKDRLDSIDRTIDEAKVDIREKPSRDDVDYKVNSFLLKLIAGTAVTVAVALFQVWRTLDDAVEKRLSGVATDVRALELTVKNSNDDAAKEAREVARQVGELQGQLKQMTDRLGDR